MKTTHDCTECLIRKLMEKHFPPERTRDYDITTTDHACGCLEFFEFDDTPGWRSKDRWADNKSCILNHKEIIEKPSKKVKDVCHKILDDYGSYEIGEEDIDAYLGGMAINKYAPHLNDEEIKALYKYMRKIARVVPGYVWENDPDAISNDPRWDD